MKKYTLFAVSLAVLLVACSNNTVDIAKQLDDALTATQEANAERAVSFEGKTLYGDYMKARFVGAYSAYVSMFASSLSSDENFYSYSATPSTITLQMEKICAPDGSGTLLTKENYIAFWLSENFRQHYIIGNLDNWYTTKTRTVTVTKVTDDTGSTATTEKTTYTFVNKIAYKSGSTPTRTTSGTKTESDGTKTALFTNIDGFTEIDSSYSAGEFTHVATVTVYNTENEVQTDYSQIFTGAALSDWESAYSSEDEDTAKKIEIRANYFDDRLTEVSNANWALVEAAFKPYQYTYTTDTTVKTGYINDDGTVSEMEVKYDYLLTQHYTDFGTAIFEGRNYIDELPYTIMFGFATEGYISIKNDDTNVIEHWRLIPTDSEPKTMIFYPFSEIKDESLSTDDDDEDVIISTITYDKNKMLTATYTLSEAGDNSMLTLVFEKKDDSILSGKVLTLGFLPVEIGLKVNE